MQSKKLVSPAHAEINITGLVIGLSKIWWLVSGKAIKTFVEGLNGAPIRVVIDYLTNRILSCLTNKPVTPPPPQL
ncbi:hypothetical protein OIU78_015622, partial [Salix suchowensis]